MKLYLIGSLRNPQIPRLAENLRGLGLEIFDDWYAAGPKADDHWKEYEEGRGNDYRDGLKGWAAQHVFEFDVFHLNRCDGAMLVLPAGRSGHLELGYASGLGKKTYVLLDRPDRWDVMYQFARDGIFFSEDEMYEHFKNSEPRPA
jgi:hypothetical protein